MNTERPQLLGTLRHETTFEIRRLLSVTTDDHVTLLELSAGKEQILAIGAPYEVSQKAQATLDLYSQEGFKIQKEENVFEPLGPVIALALRMGYNIIYDPRAKQLDRPPLNATGAIPLKDWSGIQGNGGSYEYAFDNMKIYARPSPVVPPHLLKPKDTKEFPSLSSRNPAHA